MFEQQLTKGKRKQQMKEKARMFEQQLTKGKKPTRIAMANQG